MKATHCSKEDLQEALHTVNIKYEGNVIFNRFDGPKGFTLKMRNNKCKGHNIKKFYHGFDGIYKERNLSYACWHVHGEFFDALFSINPEAIIYSRGEKITIEEGNWIDFNVGSLMYPVDASECCDC